MGLSLWGGLEILCSLRIGMFAGGVLDFCEAASEVFVFCDNMPQDVVAGLLFWGVKLSKRSSIGGVKLILNHQWGGGLNPDRSVGGRGQEAIL